MTLVVPKTVIKNTLGFTGCGKTPGRAVLCQSPTGFADPRGMKLGGRIQGPSATTHHQDQPGDSVEATMEKVENKERFPLSHGTAAAISMNLFAKFVALGF